MVYKVFTQKNIMAPFSCVYNHENIIRKYGDIMTSLDYTAHSVDSIVKSCLDINDPHLHFFNKPMMKRTMVSPIKFLKLLSTSYLKNYLTFVVIVVLLLFIVMATHY